MQTQALVEQNKQMMDDMMLAEAAENKHTQVGKILYHQLCDETKTIKNLFSKMMENKLSDQLKLQEHQLTHYKHDQNMLLQI